MPSVKDDKIAFTGNPATGVNQKLPGTFANNSFMAHIKKPFTNSSLDVFVRVRHFETLSKYTEKVYVYFMSTSLVEQLS